MRHLSIAAGALLASVAMAAPAHAGVNLLTNGGFEADVSGGGQYQTLSSGSTKIPGWTVTSGSIDLIKNYWQNNKNSLRSVDLAGNAPGAISQTISTVVGMVYQVVFYISANPDIPGGASTSRALSLTVTGTPAQNFTYKNNNQTKSNMKWQRRETYVTATSTSTTFTFAALNGGAYGAALDSVSVTATPEPEAYASMLVGLGLAGFLARRRQRKGRKAVAA